MFATIAAAPATGADVRAMPPGFYGGVSVRDQAAEQGIVIGDAGIGGRLAPVLADDQGAQALLFGGYRWRNELALEASLGTAEAYRLPGRGGVGLMLPGGAEAAARRWNLDVYGSWSFWRSLSLYGRLGYAQADAPPLYGASTGWGGADRRGRDGLNYGVGLRYDLTRSFGLRLEYARAGLLGTELAGSSLPEGDRVQFGLQFRF